MVFTQIHSADGLPEPDPWQERTYAYAKTDRPMVGYKEDQNKICHIFAGHIFKK